MLTGARSEETGQDYEHLELLLARFQEFKLRVQAGEEKYKTCEALAKRLESGAQGDQATQLAATRAACTEQWLGLIGAIQERDARLERAAEVHRFNRDVAEAVSRIGEKQAVVADRETGRDTKAVQSLIRKHEAFENDLVALEAHQGKGLLCQKLFFQGLLCQEL